MKEIIALSKQRGERDETLAKRISILNQFNPRHTYGLGINVNLPVDINTLTFNDHSSLTIEGDVSVLALNEETLKDYLDENTFLSGLFTHATLITIPGRDVGEVRLTMVLGGNRVDYLVIVAEKNARVKLIEDVTGKGFRGQVIIFVAKEGSHINYSTHSHLEKESTQFIYRNIHVKTSVRFTFSERTQEGQFSQTINKINLDSHSTLKHVTHSHARNNQLLDTYTEVQHLGRHSESNVINRTVLDGKARQIYRALIKINENLAECKGYQKSDVLLLSSDARIDTIPSLEIDHNQVSCKHSATISKINDDTIFYMMSRGISEHRAKEEIVKGFLDAY